MFAPPDGFSPPRSRRRAPGRPETRRRSARPSAFYPQVGREREPSCHNSAAPAPRRARVTISLNLVCVKNGRRFSSPAGPAARPNRSPQILLRNPPSGGGGRFIIGGAGQIDWGAALSLAPPNNLPRSGFIPPPAA